MIVLDGLIMTLSLNAKSKVFLETSADEGNRFDNNQLPVSVLGDKRPVSLL